MRGFHDNIWRKHYGFRYCMLYDALVVIACAAPEPFALFPIGQGQSSHPTLVIRKLAEHFTGQGLAAQIERADLRTVEYLDTLGVSFRAVRDEKNDDYVYLAKALITLRGRKYDGKHNHINRLLHQHTVEYVPITNDTALRINPPDPSGHTCYHRYRSVVQNLRTGSCTW